MIQKNTVSDLHISKPSNKLLLKKVGKMKLLYLLLLLPVIQLFIFHYIPLYGALIAFKDYNYSEGILG